VAKASRPTATPVRMRAARPMARIGFMAISWAGGCSGPG
jgi:hypothetical protein